MPLPLPKQPFPKPPSVLVVVGAGPRGTGFLERLAANLPGLYGDQPLEVHLVDPYPPGGGRIWREEQSPLLWMNSMAEDVTMFTDETVVQEGPVRPGPTLAEWAGIDGQTFPSRRAQGAYLRWVYEEAVAELGPAVTVHEHRTRVLRIGGPREGRQQVWLEGRAEPLGADLVVLTLGHLDAEPDAEQRELTDFAVRHGLVHLPPDFTADSDLSALGPGEAVIVRGFGLAFVDLMVLLTEGRGGRYDESGTYHPSGREPVLHVGSRRGVPYHSKIGYTWQGERPPLPRFFGPDAVDELLKRPGRLNFRRDVWPLIDKELGFAHYHRLFTAHPGRTAVDWPDFEEKYAAAGAGSPELHALVAAAVPDPADRLDLEALDHPLDGVRFASSDALQDGLRAYINQDLTRRHDQARSPDLAVFLGLLSVYGQLLRLGDVGGRWHGFFSYLASGPPGPGCANCSRSPTPGSSGSWARASPWSATRTRASSGPAAPVCRGSGPRRAPWSRRGCPNRPRSAPAARCCAPSTGTAPASPRAGCSPWTPPTGGSWTATGARTRAASRSARTPPRGCPAPSPGPAPAGPRSGRTTPVRAPR